MQKQSKLTSPDRLILAARRFILKTQDWVSTHASPSGTFKTARQFLGIFPETQNQQVFDHVGHHIHTLQYENNHR